MLQDRRLFRTGKEIEQLLPCFDSKLLSFPHNQSERNAKAPTKNQVQYVSIHKHKPSGNKKIPSQILKDAIIGISLLWKLCQV